MSDSKSRPNEASTASGGPCRADGFAEVFGHIVTDPALLHDLGHTKVSGIRYLKPDKRLEVGLVMEKPLRVEALEAAEQGLAAHFGVETEIRPRMGHAIENEQLVREHSGFILGCARRKQRHIADLLDGARLVDGGKGTLRLELEKPCAAALSAAGTARSIEHVVRNCFERELKIHLVEPQPHPDHEVHYLARKQELEARLVSEALSAPPVPREKKPAPAGGQSGGWGQKPEGGKGGWNGGNGSGGNGGNGNGGAGGGANAGNGGSGWGNGGAGNGGNGGGFGGKGGGGFPRRESKKTEEGAIYGRVVSGKVLPMIDVTSDSGEVVIAGRVLKCELRELKSGRKLFTFDMTDGTSSVTCKCFPDEERVEALTGAVKPGAGVKLRGEAQFDKFSDEMCIMARDFSPFTLQEVIRKDTAEV